MNHHEQTGTGFDSYNAEQVAQAILHHTDEQVDEILRLEEDGTINSEVAGRRLAVAEYIGGIVMDLATGDEKNEGGPPRRYRQPADG